MKKYILPITILILAIFFLNMTIDPEKEEEKSAPKAKAKPVAEFMAGGQTSDLILYKKNKGFAGSIPNDEILKVTKEAEIIGVDPFSEVQISFPTTPRYLTIAEWDSVTGEEGAENEGQIHIMSRTLGMKILIIRADWGNEGTAIYFAKVNTSKLYSYQELLSNQKNTYTVVGFFPPKEKGLMPQPSAEVFETRQLNNTLLRFNKMYPELLIEKLPTYIIFENESIVYRTSEFNALQGFIKGDVVTVFTGESGNWQAQVIAKPKLANGQMEIKLKYKGQETASIGGVRISLQGQHWSTSFEENKLDEKGEMLAATDLFWDMSNIESISATIKWNGKEETFKVKYKN